MTKGSTRGECIAQGQTTRVTARNPMLCVRRSTGRHKAFPADLRALHSGMPRRHIRVLVILARNTISALGLYVVETVHLTQIADRPSSQSSERELHMIGCRSGRTL